MQQFDYSISDFSVPSELSPTTWSSFALREFGGELLMLVVVCTLYFLNTLWTARLDRQDAELERRAREMRERRNSANNSDCDTACSDDGSVAAQQQHEEHEH